MRRFRFGALLVLCGLTMTAASAQAQTSPAAEPQNGSALKLDYASAVRPAVSTATPLAGTRTSFLRQGGAANEDSGIGVGVLGMITRTSFDVDNDFFNINARTGYGFGLWVGGNRNGRVGFTGEFIYVVRKAEDEEGNDYEFKVFQIPAVFHINFGSRSRNGFGGYIVVGPSFAINLGEEINGADFGSDFSGADIGLLGGVGFEFFRIGIEGRGNWGLKSITDEGAFADSKTFTFELLGKFAFN